MVDGHDAWLVLGYAEVRAALSDSRLSKDLRAALASGGEVVAEGLPGPAFARHMLVVDPPDHTRLRRLVAAAFSVRRIEGLRPHVQAIVDELLDGVAGDRPDQPVDLVSRFAFPLPFTVICELLGVPPADRAGLGRDLTAMVGPTSTPSGYAVAKQASDRVVETLTSLVATKTVDPSDDLVSALISARDGDERLSQQELLSTIFQLIVAGHDTTASLIENGVVAFFRHPDQLAALRADPTKFAAAVEEFLRYDAPVPHATFRYALEPIEIGGATIPAGAQVIINLASANRDATQYVQPDTLNIDRADSRTSRSAMASTFVSARRSLVWKPNSHSARSCDDCLRSAPQYRSTNSTGTMATASSCAGSPNSPSSPDPPPINTSANPGRSLSTRAPASEPATKFWRPTSRLRSLAKQARRGGLTMAEFPTITHVALTVSDLNRSVPWYESLFGTKPVLDEDTGPFRHVVWLVGQTLVGLHQFPDPASNEPFNERRIGLDHLAFACAHRSQLAEWETRLNELGIPNGGIVDASYGSGVSFRDPDNIALEFFAPPG